jgi:uncharacterized protein YcfJ
LLVGSYVGDGFGSLLRWHSLQFDSWVVGCVVVGLLVGPLVGAAVGLLVGPLVGAVVGLLVGPLVGTAVLGDDVGFPRGEVEGLAAIAAGSPRNNE